MAAGSSQRPPPGSPSLIDRQIGNNRETEDNWGLYVEHRQRVDALIEPLGPRDRVCILGAGNSNSLELASLASRFAELHLADLDPVALERAIQRQLGGLHNDSGNTPGAVQLYAPLDLSGVLSRLEPWAAAPPDVTVLRALPETIASELAKRLPGPFDVVVSEGLLSQILFTCFRAIGDGPVLMSILPWVLLAHLRLLAALARPGGSCLLVTDTAFADEPLSSPLISGPDGLGMLHELERRGQLFTGTSPALLARALREKGLVEKIEAVRFVPPWRWQFLRDRAALVYALSFRARPDL